MRALGKEATHSIQFLVHLPCKDKAFYFFRGGSSHQTAQLVGTLILEFSASRVVRKETSILFEFPSLGYFVITVQMDITPFTF